MQDPNSPVRRAGALPVKTLRRWLLAGSQRVDLRQEEASLLGLPSRPSRKDPTERRMLCAFGEARRRLCEQTRAAPQGRLEALYNPWPGLRSLIGPREWMAEQDVSSRALRQARCELPAAREEAIDVNFARHRRLLSDLRMAPELYLRGRYPEEWAPVWISRGAGLVVADEYIRQGRADVLERDLLRALQSPWGYFVPDALLLALHELDAPRAHAVARRLLSTPTPPDWTELVLADDPSAEPLLRRRFERPDDRSLGALAALLARAGDAAGAELEAYMRSRDSVDGDDLEEVILRGHRGQRGAAGADALVHPPIECGELELGQIDWDRRWLQLGLDRGLPRVVAGVLRREDRAAARMVIESFGAFKRSEQSWVIRRFSELNMPERLDAIVASVKSLAGNTHIANWVTWIRPWSDGPALARVLPELRALPKDKRLRDYDYLIEMLELVSEGPYLRMDPRS